ncbi:MAG: hypothetical protein XXXJIFNMEKO3_00317 [Candidatus Erwinia impunctatus]|nr:hypothetical protein XXXJIFNMEKO_00317 [Culicoides impunctatus]
MLLPCALVAAIALMKLEFNEWRIIVVTGFLATLIMLFHHRLRHYLLLPSCVAVTGGLAAISAKYGLL